MGVDISEMGLFSIDKRIELTEVCLGTSAGGMDMLSE